VIKDRVAVIVFNNKKAVSDGEIRTAHGGVNPCGLFVGREESKAKNSKVAHKYAEHREHDEFILVQASEE
jgi:hypothetical protein